MLTETSEEGTQQLCWVPAHEGVQGNEHADKLAKDALQKEIAIPVSLGKGEGKAIIKKKGMEIWQTRWEEDQKGRRYHKLQKSIITKICTERNRREEIIITRLRLDHTGLNGTMFIMVKSEVEECRGCGVKENVEHIILHCNMYKTEMEKLRDRGCGRIVHLA